MEEKHSVKYAQQHLANERTYLAWIRTIIAIVGVGFLATSLHFTIGSHRNEWVDWTSIILGFAACLAALVMLFIATYSYQTKRAQIEAGKFVPAKHLVTVITVFLLVMIVSVIVYFLLIKLA